MHRIALLFLALLVAAPAHAAPLSAADRAWIKACADQLDREKGSRASKARYCTCMHENFDDNAKVISAPVLIATLTGCTLLRYHAS